MITSCVAPTKVRLKYRKDSLYGWLGNNSAAPASVSPTFRFVEYRPPITRINTINTATTHRLLPSDGLTRRPAKNL